MRGHGGGGGHFRLAGLLLAVSGAGRASQAAGKASAERPQMVCDRRDRADEQRPGLAGQGHSHRGKADSGNEQKAKGHHVGSGRGIGKASGNGSRSRLKYSGLNRPLAIRSKSMNRAPTITFCLLSFLFLAGCSKQDSARKIFEQGRQKYVDQDWNGAVADFNRVLTLATNSAIYANRAWAESKLNRLDDAILDYRRAIELEPTNSILYGNCAILENEQSNFDAAMSDYSKAIDLNPNSSEAYNERGWSEFQQNNFDAAIADATHSIQLNSTNGKAYGTLGWACYGKGDTVSAIEHCRKAIDLSGPNSLEADYDQGLLNFINGDYAKAIDNWSKIIVQYPSLKREIQPWIENAQMKLQGRK